MIKLRLIDTLIVVLLLNMQNLFAVNDKIFWGFFDEVIHYDHDLIDEYTDELGKKPAIVMWYKAWNTDGDRTFPKDLCIQLDDLGYMPHIVWEPNISLDDILDGVYDDDLTAYGQSILEYGGPVMLRWGHEFNGDWYPWSDFSPETYVSAYRYVHDRVESASGSGQIKWIWCPNNQNAASNTNDITDYYPGDDYVDWVAADGYNWGTSQSWSSWSTFSQVFSGIYNKLVANYPDKPIMLGEFGCSSEGGDKAAWIDNFFLQITENYTHIKAFCWFNISKETDWRFNSTAESTQAFANGLSNPIISGDAGELADYELTSIDNRPTEDYLLNVFPNPANENLIVSGMLENEDVNLQIYNAAGEIVREENKMTENEVMLNIEELECGFYFLKIQYEDYSVVEKFVINR